MFFLSYSTFTPIHLLMFHSKGELYKITFTGFVLMIFLKSLFAASGGNLVKRSLKDTIKCLEDSKFYRSPDRPTHKIWSNTECSKYYLCLDGEVFEFKCSVGLLFDVMRQICDFKQNVDNCDITAGLNKYCFSLLLLLLLLST